LKSEADTQPRFQLYSSKYNLKNTILQGDLLSSLQEERRLQQQEEKYKSLREPQKGAHLFGSLTQFT